MLGVSGLAKRVSPFTLDYAAPMFKVLRGPELMTPEAAVTAAIALSGPAGFIVRVLMAPDCLQIAIAEPSGAYSWPQEQALYIKGSKTQYGSFLQPRWGLDPNLFAQVDVPIERVEAIPASFNYATQDGKLFQPDRAYEEIMSVHYGAISASGQTMPQPLEADNFGIFGFNTAAQADEYLQYQYGVPAAQTSRVTWKFTPS